MSSVGNVGRLPLDGARQTRARIAEVRRADITAERLERQEGTLEAQLAERTYELATHKAHIAHLELAKAELERELAAHSRALKDYEATVANRDAYIAHLEQDKVNLFAYKDVLEASNKELRDGTSAHVVALSDAISRRDAYIARLEKDRQRGKSRSLPWNAPPRWLKGKTRNEIMLSGLDRSMTGIEIGAFYSPLVPKAEGWRTTVVDFTDGDALRELARGHDSELIRREAWRIEDVDVVWRGEPLSELLAERPPGGFDYLIASHVIEHIPDIVGFFREASKLLSDNGVISLAVPDMRNCFDVFKSPSNSAQALAAHRSGARRHSPETMWEAWSLSATSMGAGSWLRGRGRNLVLMDDLASSWERYQAYLADEGKPDAPYVDAHAWRFTPASFALTMLELSALGLIDFVVDFLEPSEGSEFIVQMRRGSVRISGEELRLKRTRLAHEHRIELLTELATFAD